MALVQPKIASEDQETLEQERKPLPSGRYRCQIIGCELKKTNRGQDMLTWKLEVHSTQPDHNRAWIFYNTMLEGRAAGMFTHFVRSAGFDKYVPGEAFDTDRAIGKFVIVHTVENDWINPQTGRQSPFAKVTDVEKDDTVPDFDTADIPF